MALTPGSCFTMLHMRAPSPWEGGPLVFQELVEGSLAGLQLCGHAGQSLQDSG